jgi:hypothetical protein
MPAIVTIMFGEEPGCFLHRQASFFTTFINEQFPGSARRGFELFFWLTAGWGPLVAGAR